MKKKVFISYSRKDALDIAEFRSITKYRDFEILIDDEEITFNQPWKENIVNKINESDAAILFISKNALNPESPIRSLEIPLIAKRSRDKEDNFNFFPIFLEEVGKELDEYSFTTIKEGKEVSFLEMFQVLDIEKQNTLSTLNNKKRIKFFVNINDNISHVLSGGKLSPGTEIITKARRSRILNKLTTRLAFAILFTLGLSWFTTTDAYARILIAAYEQRIESGTVASDSATIRFLADQLNQVENLDTLTTDQALKDSVAEISSLNLGIDLNTTLNLSEFNSTIEEVTTTVPITTSTTVIEACYNSPSVYKITVTNATITAYFYDMSCGTELNITGHACEYSTVDGGPTGGFSTNSYSSSCSLEFPIEYSTVSIRVRQSHDSIYWSAWTYPITVSLTGSGSVDDSGVQFIWNQPPIGPGCYPDTYPKNKQVNNSLLPLTQSEVRQNLLDYGNSYGRLCGNDLVNAFIDYWKSRTADDIKNLYPAWSESVLNTYLNGNGSGGWYNEWNSTPITTTTTTTTTTTLPQGSNEGLSYTVTPYCSFGAENTIAGVNFYLADNNITGYVQVEESLDNGSWSSWINYLPVDSGSSVFWTKSYTNVNSVTFRYRVTKYKGIFTGLDWISLSTIQISDMDCSY